MGAARLVRWGGWGLFVLVVYLPLTALAADALRAGAPALPEALDLMVPRGRRLDLLARSVVLSTAVAASSAAVGALVAFSIVFSAARGPRALRWLALAILPVPAYVHAMAWTSLVFRANVWLAANGWPRLPQTGMPLAGWVQMASLLPLAVALAIVAFAAVPRELVEAGRVARSDDAVARRIVVPLSAPLLLAGAGLVFVLSALDYSVASLYQVNVYALSIFADFSATGRVLRAAALAVPLIGLTAATVVATQTVWRRAMVQASRTAQGGCSMRLPVAARALQAAAAGVLAVQTAVLAVSLTVAAGDAGAVVAAIAPVAPEIAYSIGVSAAAAILGVAAALAVAGPMAAGGNAGTWWWLVATLPLAVPAPLVGIGLVVLWNRPLAVPVYGSVVMPVLAGAARFTPLAAVVLAAHLRRQDDRLLDAARVFQASPWAGFWRVGVPLVAPGALAAAGVVFALTLGELGATLLVAPPGHGTLTVRIYNYLHYGAFDTVAGLCLVMVVITTVAGAAAAGSFALAGRWLAGGDDG
ncbi:hypothetical protein DCC79_03980 [bacterium]|nr:MAG: hypothetical protein DCC79_03980 [bacterium]